MNIQQFKTKLEQIPMTTITKAFFNHFGWVDFKVSNGICNRIISPYRAAEKTGSFSINDKKKIFKDFGGVGIGGSSNYALISSFFNHGVFLPQEVKNSSLIKKIQLTMDILPEFFEGEKISLSSKTPEKWNKVLNCLFNNLEDGVFAQKTIEALNKSFTPEELKYFKIDFPFLKSLIGKKIIPWTHEGDDISFAYYTSGYKTAKLFEYEDNLASKYTFGIDNLEPNQIIMVNKYPFIEKNNLYLPLETKNDCLLNCIDVLKDNNVILNLSNDFSLSQQNIDLLFENNIPVRQNGKWLESKNKPLSLKIFQNMQLLNDVKINTSKPNETVPFNFNDPEENSLKATLNNLIHCASQNMSKEALNYLVLKRKITAKEIENIINKHKIGFLSENTLNNFLKNSKDGEKDFLNLLKLKIISPIKIAHQNNFLSSCSKQQLPYINLPNNSFIFTKNDRCFFFQSPFIDKLIIPTLNQKKEIVSFAARKIDNAEEVSKYSFLANTSTLNNFTSKSKNIFNIENINIKKPLLIVEGQFDAISLSTIANENVVSLGGSKISNEQINILKNLNIKEIILGLDNDATGINSTLEIGKKLSEEGFDIKVVSAPKNYKDFDEFIVSRKYPENFIDNNKISLLDFVLKQNNLKIEYYQYFKKFFELISPLIKNMEDKKKIIDYFFNRKKEQFFEKK